MGAEKYREEVLKRIAKGHFIEKIERDHRGKVVSERERVASCRTSSLLTDGMLRKAGLSEEYANRELRKMRDEGIIHCTNKMWWKR